MAWNRDQLAHVLRRTTMAAHPERMERFADQNLGGTVDRLIDDCGLDDDGVADVPWDDGDAPPTGAEDWGRVSVWWIDRMASADAGLQDRMAWLWHCWFTTSDESFDGQQLAADQLEILYRYGLSDIPTLLRQVITSGAMLRYLDAADSHAFNPNENLARELMELFTIGPGHYTEDDVRAAARALAGWEVDDEEGDVWFEESSSFVAPLVFRGEQRNWDTDQILDHLAAHPSTHRRIAAHLWHHLVGTDPTEQELDRLGELFAANELRILPVVDDILHNDRFAGAVRSRFATSVEWFVAARAATDPDGDEDIPDPWHFDELGQRPFSPPSPAGWPAGDYWVRPGSLLPRLHHAQHLETASIDERPWTAASIATQIALPPDDPAIELIDGALTTDRFSPEERRRVAWRIALTSPTAQFF